jgi:isocitrate/isopropylmalate dehydrogenase
VSTPRVALLLDGPASPLVECARRALEAVADVELVEMPAGDAALLQDCDAALGTRPEPGLAQALGHDVALLAARVMPTLLPASPLRDRRAARTDLLLACALGASVGRTVGVAFDAAERRTGRLAAAEPAEAASQHWRETVDRIAGDHPDVAVERLPAIEAASLLIAEPSRFDVIACDAAIGDVLSGVCGALTGVAPMLARATLGTRGPAVFTPFRAPPRPAASTANPLPGVLAAALLLREGLAMEAAAERLEVAVEGVLESGLRTPDLLLGAVGERRVGTQGIAAAVLSTLERA